uniref:Uncharacterized protein n=1 Tax=Laticauda laticaudata TaxID=8630 RepID=A0A8C5S2J4_LATLA
VIFVFITCFQIWSSLKRFLTHRTWPPVDPPEGNSPKWSFLPFLFSLDVRSWVCKSAPQKPWISQDSLRIKNHWVFEKGLLCKVSFNYAFPFGKTCYTLQCLFFSFPKDVPAIKSGLSMATNSGAGILPFSENRDGKADICHSVVYLEIKSHSEKS